MSGLLDVASVIGATGALIVSRNARVRKYGFIFDLIACAVWTYWSITRIGTWGAIAVQVVYISAALNGIREHWEKPLIIRSKK